MEVLYRGAEADVFGGQWAGEDAVLKVRKPLEYRLPVLDQEIRAQRTLHEAQIIHDVKEAGVKAPCLFYVSPAESLIVMQLVEGPRLKTFLQTPGLSPDEVSEQFGELVARMHRAGVVHGDLTTSNVIVAEDGLYLIDFGLAAHSYKVEDHAVDLRLIKETLEGAHSEVSHRVMAAFLRGYASVAGEKRAKEVNKKLGEIERRGRYARVE